MNNLHYQYIDKKQTIFENGLFSVLLKNIILTLVIFCSLISPAQEVKVSTGTLRHFEKFSSKFVEARNIDVWLPEGYSAKEKYAVLYIQDGQALYDPKTTWNKQAWEVDKTAGKLIAEGKIKNFIVVGIWNTAKRHPEYFPQKPYETLTPVQKAFVSKKLQDKGRISTEFKPISDAYLQFLVTELKPFIDKNFSTRKDRKNTFIAGSSMGGLISIYAICEYPQIFGGAACLSTHWPGIFTTENNPIPNAFYAYLKNNLPDPKQHRIYFDYGDQTLDSLYKPLQTEVDKIMIARGYTANNWETKFFPGDNHSEISWGRRLDIPLVFLLKK